MDALNEIAKNYGLRFVSIENSFVESQLPTGLVYLSKVTNHCDCDTVLGSADNDPDMGVKAGEKEIAKLKRSGWSQTKIQRWLDEKEKQKEKKKREASDRERKNSPEAEVWFEFIKSTVSDKNIGEFGLLKHFYNKGPETEQFELTRVEDVSVNNISYDFLMKIEDDILYRFRK